MEFKRVLSRRPVEEESYELVCQPSRLLSCGDLRNKSRRVSGQRAHFGAVE